MANMEKCKYCGDETSKNHASDTSEVSCYGCRIFGEFLGIENRLVAEEIFIDDVIKVTPTTVTLVTHDYKMNGAEAEIDIIPLFKTLLKEKQIVYSVSYKEGNNRLTFESTITHFHTQGKTKWYKMRVRRFTLEDSEDGESDAEEDPVAM